MKSPSQSTKEKRGYGSGKAATYIPQVHVGEFGSIGTTSNPIDWLTGRTVELLSQGESIAWHILRWDDSISDIQEQYKLDLAETTSIASELGIKHPNRDQTPMTSDFLVSYKNHTQEVISIKASRDVLRDDRTVEKLYIEREYWHRKGIRFRLQYKNELNRTYSENIRRVVSFYDAKDITDDISILKHLIAHKRIITDMEHAPLDFLKLLSVYEEEVVQWKITNMNSR